jgi:hypothetical protein
MVGITERGDAALDRSWAEKHHLVAGLILITKRCDKDETWGNGGKEPIKIHLQIKQGEISEDRAITIYFDNREPFYRLRKDF